ncbi:Kinesin-like protein kif27, partial [Thoreauomyces humboldtii]
GGGGGGGGGTVRRPSDEYSSLDQARRVGSLPDTLMQPGSRQQSAGSDVDGGSVHFTDGLYGGSGATIAAVRSSRPGLSGSVGGGSVGGGVAGGSSNGMPTSTSGTTNFYSRSFHGSSVSSADADYIMTPGGQISAQEARESLGRPSRAPSQVPEVRSSSATDGNQANPDTQQIMVGGELRNATIDELTTLVAFGVVLPTMIDIRRIGGVATGGGLLSGGTAMRTAESAPSTPPGTTTTSGASTPAPQGRARRNSFSGGPMQVSLPDPATLPRRPSKPTVVQGRRFSLPGPGLPSAPGSPSDGRGSKNQSPAGSASSSRRNSWGATPMANAAARHALGNTAGSSASIALELPDFERQLNARMTPAIFLAGEYVIRKREVGREMYFLSKGKVEVVSSDAKTVYSTIGPGSFFGELGVLFDIPRTASVRTTQNSFCMVLSRDDLQEVMTGFPSISQRFEKVVAARMAEVRARKESALLSRVRIAAAFNTIEEEENET